MTVDDIAIRNVFKDATILITGGTGFLGKTLTKEILKFGPKSVRIFSRDEAKHHKFQEAFPEKGILRNFVGDVRDYRRLNKAFQDADIVIHAAALKRLDLIEYNVEEAIKTNILGTLNVVNACIENKVKIAVFVSTDKACSPVNTYGASKLVGERIFIESNYNKGSSQTVFTCVRYGNVLESTGSIIPFFKKKIQRNESIPLTDSRMTRFLISPSDAVQLIFDAIVHGKGGEIFVPKLPSAKIVDIINALCDTERENSKFEVIGIRPGEKIHEILLNEAEIDRTYDFSGRYVIVPSIESNLKSQRLSASYINFGKKLDAGIMKEYSSNDHTVSAAEIKKLFIEMSLL